MKLYAMMFLQFLMLLLGLSASAATCKQYGCTRYADPDGYCAFHKKDGEQARAKKAAEEAADREVIRRHKELERMHAEEDARIVEAEQAKLNQLRKRQRKLSKIEQSKFEQPLDGVLEHKFGERISQPRVKFTLAAPYHGLTDCWLYANGTNGVDRISGHGDFQTESAAKRTQGEILEDVERRCGRRPYEIYTKSGSVVYALGFGGKDGMAHQQLQVLVRPQEKSWRVELTAFVIDNPQRTLIAEEDRR